MKKHSLIAPIIGICTMLLFLWVFVVDLRNHIRLNRAQVDENGSTDNEKQEQ